MSTDTMISDELLAKMRADAERATPGLWRTAKLSPDFGTEVFSGEPSLANGVACPYRNRSAQATCDALHIANMNPSNTLALLEELECLRAKCERQETHMQLITNLVNHQAESHAIWYPFDLTKRHPAQHALRALHAVIERDVEAIEALNQGGQDE